MAIRDRPGGASRFFDYDGGYIINISADWLAVQLDPADITAAISKLGNTNPHLADAVKTLLDSTPGAFRIIAYDKQPAHSINGAIANFNVAMFQDRLSTSMPLGLLVKASMDQIKTQMPGVKIKQLPTKLNRQGISIGSAEIEWAFKMQNGSRMALYEKQLYFQTKDSLVVVTLSAPKTIASVVAPLFDELIDGIELMEP
jgi:hypothetical protein